MTTRVNEAINNAAAVKLVSAFLPFDRSFMEQLSPTDLPVMLENGTIFGSAMDNAAIFEQYPADWTGLVVKSAAGKMNYWFIYRSEQFGPEPAFACLGMHPNIRAAIVAAETALQKDLEHWSQQAKAA